MINARKLAAVDLTYLGPGLVITEFALGVIGPIVIGLWTLRLRTVTNGIIGGYFLLLGLNYLPMLWHAVDLTRRGTARAELASETDDRRALFRKYRRQSVWLLVPFAVIAMLVVRAHDDSRSSQDAPPQ